MFSNCKEKTVMPLKKRYRKDFRALLIGINYAGTDAELNGCINDVKNINSYLSKTFDPRPADIHILTEDDPNPRNHPTKANILRELGWLVGEGRNTRRKMNLFLHYSGHGSYMYDRSKDEEDGRDETICPLDYEDSGMISDDDFREIVVDPLKNCSKVKMTVLLDCCHSGTGFDLHYNYRIVPSDKKGVHFYQIGQDKNYGKTKCKIVLFSGCEDKQYSADALIGGIYQGAMTHAFLKVLGDFTKSGRKLTYKKCISTIQDYLKDRDYEQIPQLSSSCYINIKGTFSMI